MATPDIDRLLQIFREARRNREYAEGVWERILERARSTPPEKPNAE